MPIPLHLIELVNSYYKNYHFTEKWFYIKNPGLGYTSPYMMIKLGKEDKLEKFILERLAENELL